MGYQQGSTTSGNQWPLVLGAIGVVFGDIGTSPLYTLKEALAGAHGIGVNEANVLGILSLVTWSLIILISIKYLCFVLRAHNHGEGGILSLVALLVPASEQDSSVGWKKLVVYLGIFGAALLYGDGVLTPAISVLSAVEGLEIATPVFADFVLPIALVILILLFLMQKRGTATMGKIFGPVILVWFFVLACLGLASILRYPDVLRAFNPLYALDFFRTHDVASFFVLGSVFLSVTGGEALYADMGHFGARPIQLGWFLIAQPALLLNYFGQGALLIHDPSAAEHPFYHLVPEWALVPMVFLSTLAAVIASQAVISGAYSLTHQAIHLGLLPRIETRHTSSDEKGQIFIPLVNAGLLIVTILTVLLFQSSSSLAAAYGIAVSTTMVITTLLFGAAARYLWNWSMWFLVPFIGGLLFIESSFWLANMSRIAAGGWFPLLMGLGVFILMTTWRTGRKILAKKLMQKAVPVDRFIEDLKITPHFRPEGTAVVLSKNTTGLPFSLVHNFEHNHVVHQKVVILSILTESVPRTMAGERVYVEPLGSGFYRVKAHFGFMQFPNVLQILKECEPFGLEIDTEKVTFFVGRETIIASTGEDNMALWREELFSLLSANAQRAASFFRVPPKQVIEIGVRIEI